MSKVLKVIVNVFLVIAILVAAALIVPPLLGVNTTIVDSTEMDTNLPVGSVTYAKNVYATNIVKGDKIIEQTDSSSYEYVVEEADASTGDFVVSDAFDPTLPLQEIQILNSIPRVILTIPFIGYVVFAMHSVEGLVVIILILLLFIVLFILSELWKKESEKDFIDMFDAIDENGKPIASEGYEKAKKKPVRKKDADVFDDFVIGDAKSYTTNLPDLGGYDGTKTQAQKAPKNRTDYTQHSVDPFAGPSDSGLYESKPQNRIDSGDYLSAAVGIGAGAAFASAAFNHSSYDKTAAAGPLTEQKDTFLPIERPSYDDIITKAVVDGEEPDIKQDSVTGVSIIDFSHLL